MQKNILKFIQAFLLFSLIFTIFTPYLTKNFLDLKQKDEERVRKENERTAERKIYLTGRFDPAQRKDFVLIPQQYAVVENQMYLRKETFEAYLQMQNAANEDSVDLKIASATRNFDYQKELWNNKWTGYTIVDGQDLSKSIKNEQERFKKILEYSAVPGASRHHWGTDIDINNANPKYFETETGEKVYDWLIKNAYRFGFCQTYNLKSSARETGYNEEKWHWSYLPLAQTFLQEYKNLIKNENIKGFEGDKHVPSFNLINDYVLAINPDCL